MAAGRLVERFDAWQQRYRGPSFLVAVAVRYREDRGEDFSALLSYYGFISLFPLLLVFVTVLGIVLQGNTALRNRILDTVYSKIPVVGTQLRHDATGLSSSGWLLAAGLLVSIWAGIAVMRHAELAFDLQWGAPASRPPGFLGAQLRALVTLAVVGAGLVAGVALTSLTASLSGLPWEGRVVGGVLAIAVNASVLTVAFRLLPRSTVPWTDLAIGGAVGGGALWLVQLVAAGYVGHVVIGASDVYGAFAIVLGLLVWLALLARVTLLASEVNVVRSRDFWPRSLGRTPLTAGDRNAIAQTAAREALFPDRRVNRGEEPPMTDARETAQVVREGP